MPERISAYVPQDCKQRIERVADKHNISESKAAVMLIQQGFSDWETRIRLVQIEAKLDLLVENFAEEETAKKHVQEAVESLFDQEVDDNVIGDEPPSEPIEPFQSSDILPDEWERS
jgi:hypothetical protein